MDRRILAVVGFCVPVAMWASDWRWQFAFAILAAAIAFIGVLMWRWNPYLLDDLQAHCALPHGGPDDAYDS